MQSREVSGTSGGMGSALSEVGEAAAHHGRELYRHGFTVEQVVHDYGDLCQSITDLAFERDVPIGVNDFRTFNRCLDNAIADAVTAFNVQVNAKATEQQYLALNERLGFFAHELRNLIQNALRVVEETQLLMTHMKRHLEEHGQSEIAQKLVAKIQRAEERGALIKQAVMQNEVISLDTLEDL